MSLSQNGAQMFKILSCLVLSIAAFFVEVASAESEMYSVGVSLPLSGGASAFGNDLRDALVFANRELAENRFNLVFEDDKCSGKDAVSAAQKFISIDKIHMASGFGCSEALLAAAPIYERSKTLVISAGTSAPAISEAGDYIFRTYPSDTIPTGILFGYVAEKHKQFGILVEDTSYPTGFADAFTEHNSSNSLNIVRESFPPQTTDFRSILTRLRSSSIDGLLLIATSDQELAELVKQTRSLGWNVPLYSTYFGGSPTFRSLAGRFSEGIIFPDFPPIEEALTDKGRSLFKKFRAEFGPAKTSDYYFITASSAIIALSEVVKTDEDKNILYHGEFQGLSGPFKFDEKGDIIGISQVLNTVRNEKVVRMEPS